MSIKLVAKSRTDLGKGASRRLRHADLVPAIVYGAGKEPVSITFEQKELRKVETVEAFYSSVLDLEIDGVSEKVVLKAMQRHVYKELIQHLDLLRVDASQKLTTVVPVHFLNEETADAVKAGAVISRIANEIEVICLPADLPAFVEFGLQNVEIDSAVHISDIVLPTGVESVELIKGDAHDLPLINVTMPKKTAEATEEAAAE